MDAQQSEAERRQLEIAACGVRVRRAENKLCIVKMQPRNDRVFHAAVHGNEQRVLAAFRFHIALKRKHIVVCINTAQAAAF